MKRSAVFGPLFLACLVLLSAVVAAGVYGVRVKAVRHGIATAIDRFAEQKTDAGFAQLARIDCWAEHHPALVSQVRCAAIRGHVATGNDPAAIELADRELARNRTPPRPTTVWQALFQVIAEGLDPLCLKALGGRDPAPDVGYRTMLTALQATGDQGRTARLAAKATALLGKDLLTSGPTSQHSPVRQPRTGSAAHPDADFGVGRFAVGTGDSIRCYDAHGQHCGDLVPGALVSVVETRKSNGGDVAVCLRQDAEDTPLYIRTRDLSIRTGDLSRIPSEVRTLLAEYGRASAALQQARKHAAKQNPHANAYVKATEDYKAFSADVKRLTAARDAAEGAERTKYADKLHEMKNKAPRLREAYETAKQQYESWKSEHPGSIDSDPTVMAQQQRVDQVSQQLAPYFDS